MVVCGEHMVAIASLCNQIHYFFVGRQCLMFPYSFPIRYQRSLIWSGLKCLIMRYRAGVFSQLQIWLIEWWHVGLANATFLFLSPQFNGGENISAEGCFVTLKIAVLAHGHELAVPFYCNYIYQCLMCPIMHKPVVFSTAAFEYKAIASFKMIQHKTLV